MEADASPAANGEKMNFLVNTIVIGGVVMMLILHTGVRRMVSSFLARLRIQLLTLRSTDNTMDKNSSSSPTVSAIYKYPVKSLRTVSVQQITIDSRGVEGDRRFMLVTPSPPTLSGLAPDASHRFLTQRQVPVLATVTAQQNGNALTLTRGKDSITIDVSNVHSNPKWTARVWDDIIEVVDTGDEAASFLQKVINTDSSNHAGVRLVALAGDRTIDENFTPPATRSWLGKIPQTSLNDGFPILVAFESSLEELNRRIKAKGKEPIPMSRFRPNIVIRNTRPFEEDHWKAIQIGNTIMSLVKGCPRCKQSCTDQQTGEVFEEPLETLSEFRALGSSKEDVFFAQNAVPHHAGTQVVVGSAVRVLQRGKPVWDKETKEF